MIEEIAIPEETPSKSIPFLAEKSYFLHVNQQFIKGQNPSVIVPNPFYQRENASIVLVGLWMLTYAFLAALLFVLRFGLEITWAFWLVYPLAFLGFRIPFYFIDRYGEMVNRRLAARFQREGQILEGEIIYSAGTISSWMRANRNTFIAKIGYRFETPAGRVLRRYVNEPRPDLEGVQLSAPGTPVYILYFNDDDHYLL
jgi:hypothetical protein